MPKTSVMKDNIMDLKEQIDAAFEEARFDLESTVWAGIDPVAPVDMLAPAPPPPPPAAPERTMPGPPTRVPPPPPPPKPQEAAPATRPVGSPNSLWDNFSDQLESGDAVSSTDPIAAFSPGPRMDWGPERSIAGMNRPFRKQRGEAGGAGPSIQPA